MIDVAFRSEVKLTQNDLKSAFLITTTGGGGAMTGVANTSSDAIEEYGKMFY